MKSKYLILCLWVFLTTTRGFSQDSLKLSPDKNLINNTDSIKAIVDPNGPATDATQENDKPHSVINPNKGIAIPGTTSGTLNSSVNPNTQFVIPFHKKRKTKTTSTPDSGAITPKQ
ncbi:MAG: hypothetical protein ABI416_02175 [Ginsengibacter sp.]